MPDSTVELEPARILSVAEDELSRIVLDIHDGPVQYLFTALSLLTSLQNDLADPQPVSGEAAGQAAGQALPDPCGLRISPRGPRTAGTPCPGRHAARVLTL